MKKVWEFIQSLFTTVLVVIAIAMMIFTVVSVNTFDRSDRSIFGYKAFIVNSDSMSKTDFNAGDLIFTKNVDPSTLKEGDIITFQSIDEASYGEYITHKIRALTTDDQGNPGFVTYGTTTDTDDQTIVTYPYIIGKYVGHLPKVGTFFQFLKTTPGYIICILIPFLLLIGMQGLNSIRLFKRYKKEQLEEIEEQRTKEMSEMAAERQRLEDERKKSQEMMAELMKLKESIEEKVKED